MRGMDWIEKLVSDWTEQEWVGTGAGLKGRALPGQSRHKGDEMD